VNRKWTSAKLQGYRGECNGTREQGWNKHGGSAADEKLSDGTRSVVKQGILLWDELASEVAWNGTSWDIFPK